MENLKFETVEDITGLEFNPNFVVRDLLTTKLFLGNGTSSPEQIYTPLNPQPLSLPVSYKTTTYSIVNGDGLIECAGTFTVTLPTADSWSGSFVAVKNTGGGTITIDGLDGATAIDAAPSFTLATNESILLNINAAATGWLVVARKNNTGGGSGITRSINNITGNTTAGAAASTDYVYFCTGTLTLTLPTCVGNSNRYTVKCISGVLTINTTSSQTIDGTASIGVAVEDSVDIISNNTEWKIV